MQEPNQGLITASLLIVKIQIGPTRGLRYRPAYTCTNDAFRTVDKSISPGGMARNHDIIQRRNTTELNVHQPTCKSGIPNLTIPLIQIHPIFPDGGILF